MTAATDIEDSIQSRPTSGRLVDRVMVALGRRDFRAEAQALALALQSAPEEQVPGVVDQLITLSVDAATHPGAALALGVAASGYTRVPAARRQRLLSTGHGRWAEACRLGLEGATPIESASIAELIGDSCEPLALPLLCNLIGSDSPLVRTSAGESLITLARRAGRSPGLDELTRQSIEACIAACAAEFDKHRERAALIAVIVLLNTPAAWFTIGPELAALLNDTQHPTHMALRSVLRSGGDEAVRAAAWTWLSRTPFRNACIERLNAPGDLSTLEPVLAQGHLRVHPARAAALVQAQQRRRSSSSPFECEASDALELPLAASRHALTIVGAINDDARLALAESAIADEREAVRAAAMMEIAHAPIGDEDILLDLCWDAHPSIARSAFLSAHAAARVGRLGADAVAWTSSRLASSPHTIVRALAMTSNTPTPAIMHRQRKGNRGAIVEQIRTRVRSGPIADRINAIQSARHLNLVPDIELELLTIVDRSAHLGSHDASLIADECRVAATATTALGETRTTTGEQTLLKCLYHTDDRIRANALDALIRRARRTGQLGSPSCWSTPLIIELKSDRHHRVRAGAVRGQALSILRLPAAGAATSSLVEPIAQMLRDDRVMHRISGLWLADRIGSGLGAHWNDVGVAQTLWSEVDELAKIDADETVRARAAAVTEKLHAVVRFGWGERAGTLAADISA